MRGRCEGETGAAVHDASCSLQAATSTFRRVDTGYVGIDGMKVGRSNAINDALLQ